MLDSFEVLGIYSSLNDLPIEKTINEFSGKNFSDFKNTLSEVLTSKLEPVSKEINRLLKEKNYLDEILLDGYKKANEIASKKLRKIHEIVGF